MLDNLRLDSEKLFDQSFRRKLLSDPRAAAKELGMDVPEDARIVVKANTKDVFYIPVFDQTAARDISDEDLDRVVAAGAGVSAGMGVQLLTTQLLTALLAPPPPLRTE